MQKIKLLFYLILIFICSPFIIFAQSNSPESLVKNGIMWVQKEHANDLLSLEEYESVKAIILNEDLENVSTAHSEILYDWVESGGKVWFQGSYTGTMRNKFTENSEIVCTRTRKMNGNQILTNPGELFVKNLSSDVVIVDQKLTNSVNKIYIKPALYSFPRRPCFLNDNSWFYEGSIEPILYFVPNKDGLFLSSDKEQQKYSDEKMIMLGISSIGEGQVIFDFTKIGRKDWRDKNGNNYDGSRFYNNIIEYLKYN